MYIMGNFKPGGVLARRRRSRYSAARMSDISAQTPFRRLQSAWRFVRIARDSSIATYGPEAFERDYIERQLLWRRILIVNEPDASSMCWSTTPTTTRRATWRGICSSRVSDAAC
jgi:hypothetical protein